MSAAEVFLGYNLPLPGNWRNAEDSQAAQLPHRQQQLEQRQVQSKRIQFVKVYGYLPLTVTVFI